MEICVTRFTDTTYNENRNWLAKNSQENSKETSQTKGCIYGTPVKIKNSILPDSTLLVIEMNNTKNKIEGIGIIKNNLTPENRKYYKIYSDNNYNRFIYKSHFRIDKDDFTANEKEVLTLLEHFLFKTPYHCKRGQGIQKIPLKIVNNEEPNFVRFLINMYASRKEDNLIAKY
jgi:hypothetical protein|uniref:Uncharacterized protein n=1 Tax=viral metagenome TaxID=1070528 RepID=A0A6C0CEA8_9ZZZZ